MEKPPAFQFYPKDWLSDFNVMAMSAEQEGHYIRLLSICWLQGSIPSDESQIQQLLKGGGKGGCDMVLKCFQPHPTEPGKLIHRRLEKERIKQEEWRKKSSAGGRRSAESRKNKDKIDSKGGSTTLATKNQPKVNSSSLSSSSSSNKNLSVDVGKILEYLNAKTGKKFRPTQKHRDLINARAKEGYSDEDFRAVVDNMVYHWQNDSEMCQYLRPTTLFSPKMDGYLNNPPPSQRKGNVGQISEEQLAGKIRDQIEFLKEEIVEGAPIDHVKFHMAIGQYVIQYEDRFKKDPLGSDERKWFVQLKNSIKG